MENIKKMKDMKFININKDVLIKVGQELVVKSDNIYTVPVKGINVGESKVIVIVKEILGSKRDVFLSTYKPSTRQIVSADMVAVTFEDKKDAGQFIREKFTGGERNTTKRNKTDQQKTTGYVINTKSKKAKHRIVVERRDGFIEKGMHVHHCNGMIFDNRRKNLKVITPDAHRKLLKDNKTKRGDRTIKIRNLDELKQLIHKIE